MFVNLDLYLIDTFIDFFAEAQKDSTIIDDLFADRPVEERQKIMIYLTARTFVTRMDIVEDGKVVYVIPSFPTASLPFPQIGVYMGGDDAQDFFVGQDTGRPPEAFVLNGEATAWDWEKGYYASVNYRVDIIAETKHEVIWLSRLCQVAIARKIMELNRIGVIEPRIGAADTKIEQEQFPTMVFSRAVTLSAKSLHTWNERVPVETYQTGINTAVQGV
jgi:hypothetical protein